MKNRILCLAGDGIGPEVMEAALQVLNLVIEQFQLPVEIEQGLVGGASIEAHGEPITEATLKQAEAATAVLLGAVGGPKWDSLLMTQRPEKGLLALRKRLDLFANLRPAAVHPDLADASSLKSELVAGLDIVIVRELTGGIYFGEPRGVREEAGERVGFNTYRYSESEIRRIAKVGFESAQKRGKKLCSVDKANVLEVTRLWREIVESMAKDYPDVELTHMYVDNAAMQLVRYPKQFDVILTGNMFGDILSDQAAMLTGSIGMLPSASLNANGQGMYEPCHGSAPDIAGQGKANPIAMILSVAMMLRYSFKAESAAQAIETAVYRSIQAGHRTADLNQGSWISTEEMAKAVLNQLI
jgi:3-isopropylmalate dehydrogenase